MCYSSVNVAESFKVSLFKNRDRVKGVTVTHTHEACNDEDPQASEQSIRKEQTTYCNSDGKFFRNVLNNKNCTPKMPLDNVYVGIDKLTPLPFC